MHNPDAPPSMMNIQGYDPSSRYDPATMSRVVDLEVEELDNDLTNFGEYEIQEIRTRGRTRRGFIALITLCAIAGIGVGIAMGATRGGGSGSIATTCSLGAVTTKKGYSKCEDACAMGDCCNLPADDPQSCADVRSDSCKNFKAHCAVLLFDHDKDGKVDAHEVLAVPPAEPSISQLCQWDNLASASGFLACRDACQPGNCCYENIETCEVTNPEMCDGYEACEILHVQNVVTIPPALHDIDNLCDPNEFNDPQAYKWCKEACDPGECCLEPVEACKVQNPDACKGYSVCEILHGSPKSNPTSVQSQVVTKCNTGALTSPDGVKECEEICQPALCCFNSIDGINRPNRSNSEFTGTCYTPENEDWCSQYSACQTLQHVDKGGVEKGAAAKAAIEEACSNASPDGHAICSNVCAPAKCCFDGTQNCFANGPDSLRCSDYDACGILYHHDKDPTTSVNPNPIAVDTDPESTLKMAEHVVEVCSLDSIATSDGKQKCLNLCEDNLCCFASGDYNCMKEHAEMCVVYAGCSNIVNGKNPPDLESSNPLPSDNAPVVENPISITNEVSEMCQESKLKTKEGVAGCHDICKAHLCCFSSVEVENCYVDHPTECDDYAQCSELVMASKNVDDTSNHDVLTKEVVDEVCDASSLRTDEGLANCHAMCAKHLCCFSPRDTKSNCMDTIGSEACIKHEACTNLISAEAGTDIYAESSYENTIEFICSEENKKNVGVEDCETACDERRCCFSDGPGNCRVTDEAFCEEADVCLDDSEDEDYGEDENYGPESMGTEGGDDAINAACADSNIKTEQGRIECKTMCKPYECCWTMVEDNKCYKDLPECKTYTKPCLRLGGELHGTEDMDGMGDMTGSGDPEPMDNNPSIQPVEVSLTDTLETICSETSLQTEYGLKLCRESCAPHSCCFGDEEGPQCGLNNVDECLQFGPCTNLHQFEGTVPKVQSASADKINDVQKACDESYLNEYGYSQCKHHCESRACCFTNNLQLNCFEEERSWCGELSECKIMKTWQSTKSSNNTPINVYKELNNVCSKEAIAGDQGQSCLATCEPNECCYVHGPNGCYEGNEQLCSQFQICKNLFTAVP